MKKDKATKPLTRMIPVCQQIQTRPRSAMRTTGQHHPFQQDNCLIYNHVATVTIQLGIKKNITGYQLNLKRKNKSRNKETASR